MKQGWIVFTVLLLAGLAACRSTEPQAALTSVPTYASSLIRAEAVTPLMLLRNSAALENSYVQVAGQYKPLPIAVCSGEVRQSPASWALVQDGAEILAGGYEGPLRQLAVEGQELVVQGYWQQWQGPVGCDRRNPIQEIWYLEVERIISPNPLLAAVDVEVDDGQLGGEQQLSPTALAAVPTASPSPPPTLTPFATPFGSSPVATTAAPLLPTTATATPAVVTPSGTLSAVVTSSPTATASPSLTPSATATGGVPEPTATGSPQATIPVTVVPGAGSPIFYDWLVKKTLNSGQSQQWDFSGVQNNVTTINAGPSNDLDIILRLVGPGGIVATANNGGPGQPESISQVVLQFSGDYQILVTANGSSAGSYGLALLDDSSEPFFVFRGLINYGDSFSGNLAEGIDHLWNFEGQTGQEITIELSSASEYDMLFYLNGPDGEDIEFVDDDFDGGPPNDTEELVRYRLTQTGLYSIGVGEATFSPAPYSLSLELN